MLSGFLGLKALCFYMFSELPQLNIQHIEFLRVFGVPKGPRPKAQAPKAQGKAQAQGPRVPESVIRYELGWPGVAWYGLGAWAAFTRNLVGTLGGPYSLRSLAFCFTHADQGRRI